MLRYPAYSYTTYSKTPIYCGVWGQGNIRGKSGSAVNRGFVWFKLCMFSPIWGQGNGRGISGFAVNRGAVNRGFTVLLLSCEGTLFLLKYCIIQILAPGTIYSGNSIDNIYLCYILNLMKKNHNFCRITELDDEEKLRHIL